MKVLASLSELAQLPRPVHLAMGFFDGVHLGHQRVLASAETPGALRGVLTFEEHPLALLCPERQPLRLTPSQRPALMEAQGMEVLVMLPFTRDLAQTSAADFLAQLAATGRVCGLSVGENWRFGRGGAGNTAFLQEWGRAHGLRVVVNELAELDGERICSSRIRELLAAGDLPRATAMLGHPFTIEGTVEQGQHLARTFGFPTANIRVPWGAAVPPFGVYAVRWGTYRGVANLGLRPTIEEQQKVLRLEAHFFDCSENLYGRCLTVELRRFMRAERRFASPEALRAAIAADAAAARLI